MKIKAIFMGICLGLSTFLSSAAQDKPPQKEERIDKAQVDKGKVDLVQGESYIRKDLLRDPAQEEDMQPPLRNIFSPRRPGSSGAGSGPGGIDAMDPEAGAEEEEMDAAEEEYVEVVDIRYVGHIRSQARTVALILLEGEAMAVKAGEIVAEGVRILKITPTEIQYEGLDSETKTVPLEGDDR